MASNPFVGGVCVLLLSMILVGASAADYYSSSSETPKTQPKIQSGSYEKPVAQSMPKPEESASKPQPKIVPDFYSKPTYKADPHYDMPKLSIPKPDKKLFLPRLKG
ncbi:unnamed protein product [Linum trigynum]|uniref:Uncharacterized protein n=1 Tax=Linum trigynum TaxID=586398 RepID=A0AAV2DMX0_9ROSI